MLTPAITLLLLAADIHGSWVAQRPGPGGEPMETQFNFVQKGETFGGTVLSAMGEQRILNGKIDGDAITFEVVAKMMGEERRMGYRGKLDGDVLRLTMAAPGMGPGGPEMGGAAPGLGPNGPGRGGLPGVGGVTGGPPDVSGAAPGMGPGGPGRGPREMVARRGVSESLRKQREADAARPKPVLPRARRLGENGLARTPPMGWNSWNKFGTRVSDALIRETADAMVSSGMRDAGYVYLTIDDGWQGKRDEAGNLRPNERFPDMKALGDYVHGKGLKFGIYSSPGPRTCGRFEGSYGYEARDARMFASWGVDFLKYDLCSAGQLFEPSEQARLFQLMAEQLRATGRPIVYSISQYGLAKVQDWAAASGANMWRTTSDIRDQWESMTQIGFGQNGLEGAAGPGHWNDPDMLEIGNGGLNGEESRTHMALWSMLAAPLLAGNDVRSATKETLGILTNPEVVAINQDALGRQGYRLVQEGETETWVKPLRRGEWAVALFNRGSAAAEMRVGWAALKLKRPSKVRDLWQRAELAVGPEGVTATVAAHGVVLVRVTP